METFVLLFVYPPLYNYICAVNMLCRSFDCSYIHRAWIVNLKKEVKLKNLFLKNCYFLSRNYKWWWRSFLVPGFCGIYIFIFSIAYYFCELHIIRISSTLLYFGIMGLLSFSMFLLCGAVGFISSCLFVR